MPSALTTSAGLNGEKGDFKLIQWLCPRGTGCASAEGKRAGGAQPWPQPCRRAMPPVAAPWEELGSLIFLINIITLLLCVMGTGLSGPRSAPSVP